MKRKAGKIVYVLLLAGILMTVSACGNKEKEQETAQSAAAEQSDSKQAADEQAAGKAAAGEQANTTQISEGQPENEKAGDGQAAAGQAEAGGTETTEAESGETAGQTASETQESAAVNTQAAGDVPRVTEDPTDESLTEGYSCMYIASAENADKIEWRAASPDGKVDISYSEISEYFPYLEYMGEDEEAISLYNIPAGFDGWESYCRFTNSAGSADSRHAVTHVKALQDVEAEQAEQQSNQTEQEPVQAETVEG